MSTGAPKATAQGTLAKTPFAHLLQYLLSRELSGTLAVWPEVAPQDAGTRQDRVLFNKGIAIAMRSTGAASELLEGLLWLFARKRAPYAFYQGQNLLGRSEGTLNAELDPYLLLSHGVRTHATSTEARAVLAKLGDRPVRLRVGFPVARLDLEPWEEQLVDAVRREPMTIRRAASLGNGDGDGEATLRVLYLLTLVKGFESVEASAKGASVHPPPPGAAPATGRNPSGSQPRVSAPSSGRTPKPGAAAPATRKSQPPPASIPPPEDAPIPSKPADLEEAHGALWDEVVARFADMDHQTHFELLGVTQKSNTSEVTSAYFALVKKLHPDRIPTSLAPLSSHIKELFERITEAHEVLTSEDKRIAYVKAVSDGGGTRATDRMMAAVVESAMDIQKAEVLLRRRNYSQAKAFVDKAIARNPEEQAHYALRGWLNHLLTPGRDAPLDDILADIDRTLADNERNARAHYYKGVVLKRKGEPTAAFPHFRKATELDPRHIEAQREVRLAQIRRQSVKPGKKPGGLWGKLFSRGGD